MIDPRLVAAVAAELDRHQGRGLGNTAVGCWCGWTPQLNPAPTTWAQHRAEQVLRVVRDQAAP